ncbi:MAG: hypothetical protein HC877_18995 [Thioploca sp.]|nr:hypothetical protein [Thioploca sp.]
MRHKGIVIHCSDSNYGDANIIDSWHQERDFKRSNKYINKFYPLKHIGYHFVILNGYIDNSKDYVSELDGYIQYGRALGEVGSHAIGNNEDVGICLIGKKEFSNHQIIQLYTLCLKLMLDLRIEYSAIIGHYETKYERNKPAPKTCPNIGMNRVRTRLNAVQTQAINYLLQI